MMIGPPRSMIDGVLIGHHFRKDGRSAIAFKKCRPPALRRDRSCRSAGEKSVVQSETVGIRASLLDKQFTTRVYFSEPTICTQTTLFANY
jgi:hypothetical protein